MDQYDVVVVGAGPAGSSAARASAIGGARTLLLDRRPELGHPVQCGEFLPTLRELQDLFPGHEGFAEAYEVPEEAVLQRTREMACVAPGGREYRFPVEGYSVSRRSFDKILAHRAESAGAELRHPTGVSHVTSGGQVHLAGGGTVQAKVIVAADGPLSVVGRCLGFRPPRQMYRMLTATVEGEFEDRLELFFGSVAPGGYAWLIPKSGEANVGLGVTELPPGSSLSALLARFLRGRGLPTARDLTRWWVPLGPPPPSARAGPALFTGDAANLVMATNGGGIPTAMISGWDAGGVAAGHVRDGRPLGDYDELLRRHLYAPLRRGWRLKAMGDRVIYHDPLLALGMRYLGAHGLDEMIRLRKPARLGGWRA